MGKGGGGGTGHFATHMQRSGGELDVFPNYNTLNSEV